MRLVYYKYVPGYGGYSYYTTCMLDINSVGKITYNDLYPVAYDSNKNYVVSPVVNGREVDLSDASTYYRVSTVNYVAAGSCNFDGGVSLWPLNQIVNDTTFQLRAERSGTGSGRIYTITCQATDAYGNSTVASVTVTVPHDKSK